MFPARFLWKPVIQKLVTGRWQRPRMRRNMPSPPGKLVRPGLYLHVPFCKNLCPFCPYNRVEYQDDLFAAYERAMHQEIELYRPALDGQKFTTLYIGGGTPTVNLEGLLGILQHMVEAFGPVRDICIELHPANMETECLQALKNAGVTMLSIGVEAATDHVLAAIGRNHDGKTALDAASRAVEVGFNAVNADLMFALPEQSLEDWARDLDAVLATGVDQISTYPMFTFPYSDLGQSERIRKVTRPKSSTIRAMLDLTNEKAKQAGFQRCAVWSWLRPDKKKFSSITRHHYIGFGPSSASMTGNDFWVNTFDVKAYSEALPDSLPIALSTPVNQRLEMAYWLYWRVYELDIRQQDFQAVFGPEADLRSVFSQVLVPFTATGMAARNNGDYRITDKGAYWIHRLQNEYSLNYINRVWGACRREPWPKEVVL